MILNNKKGKKVNRMDKNKEDDMFYGNNWSMDFNEKIENKRKEELKDQSFTHYESPLEEMIECELLYEDGMWN